MAEVKPQANSDEQKPKTPIATRLKRRSIEATKEYNNMLERTLSDLDEWGKLNASK